MKEITAKQTAKKLLDNLRDSGLPKYHQDAVLDGLLDKAAGALLDRKSKLNVRAKTAWAAEVLGPKAAVVLDDLVRQERWVADLVRSCEKYGVDNLDDLVQDCASQNESDLNNRGVEEQIRFMAENWGPEAAAKAVEDYLQDVVVP